MAVDLKLSMKLGQQMVMTPQLQAAIKLLQMNRLELTESIQTEMLENPLLEDSVELSDLEQKKNEIERQETSDKAAELSPDENKNPDFDWENYLEQSFSYSGKSSGGLGYDPSNEDGPGFEAVATKKKDLTEHLVDQVNTSDLSDDEREIASVIIASLDEWGYLKEPIEDIAKRCKVDPQSADLVLRLIQEFDPPGVGARDLKECLLLQLRTMKIRRKSERDLLRELIETQLHNLEKKNFKAIAKELATEGVELFLCAWRSDQDAPKV